MLVLRTVCTAVVASCGRKRHWGGNRSWRQPFCDCLSRCVAFRVRVECEKARAWKHSEGLSISWILTFVGRSLSGSVRMIFRAPWTSSVGVCGSGGVVGAGGWCGSCGSSSR